jgi:endonuclease/exonuclease/phosphatase family metal-dependent hydrolase
MYAPFNDTRYTSYVRVTGIFWALMLVAMTPAAFADEWMTIGSWNIENLGKGQGGQKPKALAEHLQLVGLDVLALQEIHDDDGNAATHRNSKLDATFAILNTRPGNDWEYVLFPKREASDTTQLTGVAWNKKRVSKVGDPLKIAVVDNDPQFDLWKRHPHAVEFSVASGKTDFVIIPLHMKSNIWEGGPPKKQREGEAKALVAALAAVKTHFGDDDLILIGDTNCITADESALAAFSAAGFEDLNTGDRATYISGGAFDRILVKGGQPEFKFSRQYVLVPTDSSTHEGTLSDHFLVVSSLKVLQDDD